MKFLLSNVGGMFAVGKTEGISDTVCRVVSTVVIGAVAITAINEVGIVAVMGICFLGFFHFIRSIE